MAEEENMTKIDLPPGAEVMPSDGFDGMTGDDSLDVAAMGGKQGGVCCRCCCDYRRAVIIMSSVSIFLGFLGIISAFRGQPDGRFGDDQVAEDIQEITKDYRSQQVLLACIGFVFAGLSLFGSLKFRWNLVCSTTLRLEYSVKSLSLCLTHNNKTFFTGCCYCRLGSCELPSDCDFQLQGTQ